MEYATLNIMNKYYTLSLGVFLVILLFGFMSLSLVLAQSSIGDECAAILKELSSLEAEKAAVPTKLLGSERSRLAEAGVKKAGLLAGVKAGGYCGC